MAIQKDWEHTMNKVKEQREDQLQQHSHEMSTPNWGIKR